MGNAWIWVGLGFVLLVVLLALGGFLHEHNNRKKTAKLRDLEQGARAGAAGKYRLNNHLKTGKSTVGLSKSRIGKPQALATGGPTIPPYAHVKGNHYNLPARAPPMGPRAAMPPRRMATPAPRMAAGKPPMRPSRPDALVNCAAYDIRRAPSRGPVSPMTAMDYARSRGRHSAVSP